MVQAQSMGGGVSGIVGGGFTRPQKPNANPTPSPMGKLGKKRKRAEPKDIPVDGAESPLTVEGAVALLTALTRSGLSLYKSAPFRPLRTALYPLLQSELDSGVYFEPPLHTGGPRLEKQAEAEAEEETPLTLVDCAPRLARCPPYPPSTPGESQ